jgi:hypothetical protein
MGVLKEAKWTETQRAAVAHAVEDRGLGATEAARLAAAGHLEHDGVRLEPFPIPASSVRTYAQRLRTARAGRASTQVTEIDHRDLTERYRQRLARLLDDRLNAHERRRKGSTEPEELRQLARAVREFAAIPAKTDPRPPPPGAKVEGQRTESETRGGLSGQLVADHRATAGKGQPAPDAASPHGRDGDPQRTRHDVTPTTATKPEHTEPTEPDTSPGSVVRALAARHGVQLGGQGAGAPTGG